MNRNPDPTGSRDGADRSAQHRIALGGPWLWSATLGFIAVVAMAPIIGLALEGSAVGVIVFLVLLGPLAAWALLQLYRVLASPNSVTITDHGLRFGRLAGSMTEIGLSELSEVRYETYTFLHQLVFDGGDGSSVAVKRRLGRGGFGELLHAVETRTGEAPAGQTRARARQPSMPFAGHKTRIYKPAREVAPGSHRPFKHYLSDEPTVKVDSVQEITQWLSECRFERDVYDEWLKPSEFERKRAGDCEDHALWAWNQLHRLGLAPELQIGRRVDRSTSGANDKAQAHVWVRFRTEDGDLMNLEATDKSGHMVQPWSRVSGHYVPRYGVDVRSRVYRYR